MFRPFQLRFRRRLRKSQRQVEDLGQQAEQHLERHLLRRFGRLGPIRRFLAAWIGFCLLLVACLVWQLQGLSAYYQSVQPVAGGIYSEGLLGSFTDANPLFATSPVDTTVSHLIFAGLFKYNDHNKLTGDLATGYSVDDKGTTYTIRLRPGLTWQDGRPLTSADVVFTYQTIQNPDTGSPLSGSWQGITIAAPDAHTVTFTLPNVLASFPTNLTNGIVPQHLLGKVPAADLRSIDFNTQRPVGAGPFSWLGVQVSGNGPQDAQEQVGLVPFAHYSSGMPKLKEFIVHAYANQQQLVGAFEHQQLTAVAGLDSVPPELASDKTVLQHNFLLTAGTFVFFKTSSGVLSDVKVRQALVQAADPTAIIHNLPYETRAMREPLLQGQLAYDPASVQKTGDLASAKAALDQDGWTVGSGGTRAKAGQPLTFALTAADTPEDRQVTAELQKQWQAIGVKVDVQLQNSDDFSSSLKTHGYDALLYGISIGPDPDVFVYWDSSQANPLSPNRLNLSEYSSATVDTALEGGRTRLDPALRTVKYKPFLQAWQQDAPALGLYQPRFVYLTESKVYGLSDHALNIPTDRFSNVQNWEIRTAKVTN